VKIVVPQIAAWPAKLKILDGEPEPLHYRIVFMEQNMGGYPRRPGHHVATLGRAPAPNARAIHLCKAYRHEERIGKSWCAGLGARATSVSYQTVVNHSGRTLPQLTEFLGATDKLDAMRASTQISTGRESDTDP
jgi:hypothetical protein